MRKSLAMLSVCLFGLNGTDSLAAAPAARGTPLPDAVDCIYLALSPDLRENAVYLTMLAFEIDPESKSRDEVVEEIEALVEEGHDRCLDRYAWISAQSQNSMGYAMLVLLRDVQRQFMTDTGLKYADPDDYLAAHKAELLRSAELTEPQRNGFQSFLEERGWNTQNEQLMANVAGYLRLITQLERFRRDFSRGTFDF